MAYSVDLTKGAQRDLAILESDVAQRVQAALELLRGTPRAHGCTKLEGEKGAYRMRVGTIASSTTSTTRFVASL
jgi:mRNA-degrading endonuclease RelE of RelBE toxin-antitoxin system